MAPVQQLGTSGKGGAVSPVNCLIQDNLNTSQNKRSRQPTLFGQKKLEITNKNWNKMDVLRESSQTCW